MFIDEKNYTDPENLKFDLFSSIFTILPIFWKPENRLKIEEIHEIWDFWDRYSFFHQKTHFLKLLEHVLASLA